MYVSAMSQKSLSFTFISPSGFLCMCVGFETCSKHSDHLVVLQKMFLIMISNTPCLAHTNPLFHSNKILKLSDIYNFKTLVQNFKNRKRETFNVSHEWDNRLSTNLVQQVL